MLFSPGKVGREGRKVKPRFEGASCLWKEGTRGKGGDRTDESSPLCLFPVVIGNPEGRALHTEFWKEDSSTDSGKFSDFGKVTEDPWGWFSNLQNEEFGLN